LPRTESLFNSDGINGISIGFTTVGTGCYRKNFRLPVNQKNKRISILFDGVYMNSDVWINVVYLGNHPYGYTSFYLRWWYTQATTGT
jgi:beta-galactosidase